MPTDFANSFRFSMLTTYQALARARPGLDRGSGRAIAAAITPYVSNILTLRPNRHMHDLNHLTTYRSRFLSRSSRYKSAVS